MRGARTPRRRRARTAIGALAALLAAAAPARATTGEIRTLVPAADGGIAATAAVLGARSLAADGLGALYVGDANRVRRVDPSTGAITTVVGDVFPGSSGDGGPAARARLHGAPAGLAFDRDGALLISDTGNCRIRRAAPDGTISTVAGNGTCGASGDGGDALAAQVRPLALAADRAGSIYFATSGARGWLVRRVAPDGTISTVLGGGDCVAVPTQPDLCHLLPGERVRLVEPTALATDSAGNLYVAQPAYRTVLKVIMPSTLTLRWVGTGAEGSGGDGGPGALATVSGPEGLAVDARDNLYVSDRNNWRIRRVDPNGIVAWFAGAGYDGYSGDGGSARQARMRPRALAVAPTPEADLFLVDGFGAVVRRIRAGTIARVAGAGRAICNETNWWPDVPVAPEQPCGTANVAVDAAGRIYTVASFGTEVRRLDPATGSVTVVARSGSNGGEDVSAIGALLGGIVSVSLDADGSRLFVATWGEGSRVRAIDLATGLVRTVAGAAWVHGYSGDGGPATAARLSAPYDVAEGPDGSVYVSDSENCRIRRVSPAGMISTVAGNGECGYSGDGGPATSARIERARGVAVHGGSLYLADLYNRRVRAVDLSTGIIATFAGGGPFVPGHGDGGHRLDAYLEQPNDVEFGDAGEAYVATVGRVRRVAPDGTITTVAGDGTFGEYCRDGEQATSCALWSWDEAIPAGGDLYLAGTGALQVVEGPLP